MIRVNKIPVLPTTFPDGTCGIFNFTVWDNYSVDEKDICYIDWKYESDSECILLKYIVDHIKQNNLWDTNKLALNMYYVPNARMDRTKSVKEVFTLKYFADFINSLNFGSVYIFDPHSDVTPALFKNVKVLKPESYINQVINRINYALGENKNDLVIYFPDYGAKKRYGDLLCIKNKEIIYGEKERDWETGQIKGLKICDKEGNVLKDETLIKDKIVLMIDDIVSYGGTLAYSADAIKKYGAKKIYAYTSHSENSVLDEEKSKLLERFKNGTVQKLYTSTSLYSGNSEYIETVEIY